MSLDGAIQDARKAINRDLIAARLGDNGQGNPYDLDTPGNYWVQKVEANGNLSQPISMPIYPNANIPPKSGLAVHIGYDEFGTQCIWRASRTGLLSADISPLILNPLDTAVYGKVNGANIANFFCQRHGDLTNYPLTVVVFPGAIERNDTMQIFSGATVDLSALVPGDDLHCYAVVFIKTDLTLEAFASTPVALTEPLTDVDMSEAIAQRTADSLTIWAWELSDSQTVISPDPTKNVDLRQWLNVASGSSGMASFTVAGDSGTPQTISNGDTLTIAGGTGLSSVASATDTVTLNLDDTTVSPGAYTNASLTVDAQGRLTAASSGATPAPNDATYITQTPNGTLTNEQAMSLLATGLVKNTTTTGVQSIAAAGTDYTSPSGTENLSNKTISDSVISDGITLNNGATNEDVIVKGATDANTLYVDTSANKTGFGTSTPDAKVTIKGTVDEVQLKVLGNGTQTNQLASFQNSGGTPQVTISASGAMVVNEAANSVAFRVESNGDPNNLYSDGTFNNVGVGTGAPDVSAKFHVFSTTLGSIPAPIMTAAQRDAIVTPSQGLMAYASDTDELSFYDGQRWRAVEGVGWIPFAFQYFVQFIGTITSGTTALVANGGSAALPVWLSSHMLLQSVTARDQDASGARSWGWDIYKQYLNNGNSGENTLTRVAASNGADAFTATVASNRTLDAASAPVYLAPGLYWLVIQNRHASNTFALQSSTTSAGFINTLNWAQTKTTTNPNGSTLDFVAATWTKNDSFYSVRLNGRVFGETTAY